MAGADDPLVPLLNAKLMHRLIPGSELRVFDCGHLFLLTRTEASVAAIREFLDRPMPRATPDTTPTRAAMNTTETPAGPAGPTCRRRARRVFLDHDRPGAIDAFAHCTGDHQWIHVDVERARRERPSIGTVAHGYLTLSLLAPTTFEILSTRLDVKEAINYGLDKLRFLSFVRAGSRVRNRIEVLAVDGKGQGRWLLTTENTVEIEGEPKPALVAVTLAVLTS